MNYTIETVIRTHLIIEIPTGLIIKEYKKKSDALVHCRRLNLGGGFDGNTPPFMTRNIEVKESEDD